MFPFLGYGVGLRTRHYTTILREWPPVDWFEILSENYMVAGGRPLWVLDQIAERYPVVMHGVSLSIGTTDPLRRDYLSALKKLAQRVRPRWISDHLCWTGVGGHNAHDLLPLPYTEETLRHVVGRVKEVQDFLGRPILLENVSSYMSFTDSRMTEWEFLTAVVRESGCYILLDINNIYVSSVNHSFDPLEYIEAIPVDRLVQFHLAGHSDHGKYLLDTHDHSVKPVVWRLYEKAVERFGRISTLIEWDDRIPPFQRLFSIAQKAKRLADKVYERTTAQQLARGTAAPLAADLGA